MTRRVLVTGSRTFTDTTVIRDALAAQWGDGTAVLVTGACPRGADRLAEQCWTAWGGRVERHPADWSRHGRAAGFRRNTHMVAAGADVCLAFLHGPSRGTRHTAELATRSGIPTRRYPHPDTTDTTDTAMTTENDGPHDHDHARTPSDPPASASRSVLGESMAVLWQRWQDWNARDITEHAARAAEARGDRRGAAVLRTAHSGAGPTAMEALTAQADLAARLSERQWQTVRAAREQGASWAQIADTTGTDPAAARARYLDAVHTHEVAGAFATPEAADVAWAAAGPDVDEQPDSTRATADETMDGVGLPPQMLDGIAQRRTGPTGRDDPAELQARLAELRERVAAATGTPAGGWQTVGAEQAAHDLAARGVDLDTARAMIADYLRETSTRVGVPAHEWGLDQGDLDAVAADHQLPTTLPPAAAYATTRCDDADQARIAELSRCPTDDDTGEGATADEVGDDGVGWSR